MTLTAPFLLVCATDGCFGYVPSPMHFEELVLRTLASAATEEEWSGALQAEIDAVTGDDAAMATIGVGADFGAFQQLFAPRLAELTEQYTSPLNESLEQLRAAEQALLELRRQRAADLAARWRRYSRGYEQYLQSGVEPEGAPEDDRPEAPIWNPAKRISTGPGAAGAGLTDEPPSEAVPTVPSGDAAEPSGDEGGR